MILYRVNAKLPTMTLRRLDRPALMRGNLIGERSKLLVIAGDFIVQGFPTSRRWKTVRSRGRSGIAGSKVVGKDFQQL